MPIAHYLLVPLIFLSQIDLHSAEESKQNPHCPSFKCGRHGEVSFPFSTMDKKECGLCYMNCTGPEPTVQFLEHGRSYFVNYINIVDRVIIIRDQNMQVHLKSNRCDLLNNFTEQVSPLLSLKIDTLPIFKCKPGPYLFFSPKFFEPFQEYTRCKDYVIYFYDDPEKRLPHLPDTLSSNCSVVHLPYSGVHGLGLGLKIENITLMWEAGFTMNWTVLPFCRDCHNKGGRCHGDRKETFRCLDLKVVEKGTNVQMNAAIGTNVQKKTAIVGLGTGIAAIVVACIIFIMYQCHKRNKLSSSSTNSSQDKFHDQSLIPNLEKGSSYFRTHIFTYEELDEATNHFDSNKELGDGGFGVVYHGRLRDGRVVAVKRLFEHNYKRVEHFINEIAILSQLRHQNLVSLYGCTSHQSRELLLVYEYIPNGTVADHLHGDRANTGLLTWPIRMGIAIESADALAYLHASDIIHRDVKTRNILLDNNFRVKIADFGLSRLFPTDVTHVSTAPQGTPGYVDPQYYQCYQLNDKSDVYSFGVVLIELISSKPAVDIGRHRHDINLANMALIRIHNEALNELVDPSLGFQSNYSASNMITLVAELAFRCLQQEQEMRPCMAEVLDILKGIESEKYKKQTNDTNTSADTRLLKSSPSLSPKSVTNQWVSNSTTSSKSC